MHRFSRHILLLLILLQSCKTDPNDSKYVIDGYIENAPRTLQIYLMNDHTGIYEDSTSTHNGHFNFEGTTTYPQRYSVIYQSDTKKESHFLWVENTSITIDGIWNHLDKAVIEGGHEQKLFSALEAEGAFFYPEYQRLIEEEKQDSIEPLIHKLSQTNLNFCIKNANSYMAVEMLYRIRNSIHKDTLEAVLKTMNNEVLNSNYGKSLKLHYQSPELKVGVPYKDFSAKTLSGKTISISELTKKGKPILLIFGGLGCMQKHGRAFLKSFNENYHDQVEILAFVFARNKDEWIQDSNYSLNISLLSDMKGDHSPIKINYGVQITPTVFIIDQNGIIAWKSEGYGPSVNDAVISLLKEQN